MDFLNLKGKRILVTGASSGIGRELALFLDKQEAIVILVGRDEARLNETRMKMSGADHVVYPLDLTEFASYKRVFEEITKEGLLYGMVHCAGIAVPIPIKMMTPNQIKQTFDINYVAFMQLASYFVKRKYSKGGSIVAVSALSAHRPQKCMSVYAASKGAIEAAVKSLAYELMTKGYRVNTVIPGPIATEMAETSSEIYGSNIPEDITLGMGQPKDVVNGIAYLLSDASRFITGREIYIDGGRLV